MSSSSSCQLATRAEAVMSAPSVSAKYNAKIMLDLFHVTDNPKGYVDLGLAENKLCEDLLTEKLRTLPDDRDIISMRYYANFTGIKSFRETLKVFMEKKFNSIHTLDPDNITVLGGVTSVLESVAFSIADPGEYIMTTTPYYYRVKNDFLERAQVDVLEVPLYRTKDPQTGRPYSFNADMLEEVYLQATKEGKVVKGLLLINPSNPLGTVCTPQEIQDVLSFCAKYSLHAIVDEIYALSIHDSATTFTSVLSLPHPDPLRTHFIWGFSKDFGLSGYRCGILWSANTSLISHLSSQAVFQMVPSVIQWRLQHILEDIDWVDNKYIPEFQTRLRRHYTIARDTLQQAGVDVNPAYGSIFVWFDCSKFLSEVSHEAEMSLFERFLQHKVFVLPGQLCYSREPGCYRMICSLDEVVLREENIAVGDLAH